MSITSRVRDILQEKGSSSVWCIHPDQTVFNALRLMAIKNVAALVVVEEESVIGIITERDYARKVVLQNRSSRECSVREIMDTSVYYVTPEDTVEGCLSLMTKRRIRHLPVFQNGKMSGLVSMGDVVKAAISDREFMIDELTRYVTNSLHGIEQNIFIAASSTARSREME